MTFKDVIKNSVYDSLGGAGGLEINQILLILIVSLFIGLYIYLIYKFSCKSAFYSNDLNITLAGLTIIVSAIMIAMQSNLIVSLGMVGALSIVRFRNAVKSPLDLLYLFWSVSAGIICGVGLYILAIVLCCIMTILIFLLELVPNSKAPSLLIVTADNNTDGKIVNEIVKNNCKYYKEKSCCIKNCETEYIIEVKTSQKERLLHDLSQLPNTKKISYLSHDGEMRV